MSPQPVDRDRHRRARYEALFAEVYEPLQRFVRRRAPAEAVDDVVAEALTVAWRRLDDVPDGLALPWCVGVARRCLANQRRGDARRTRLMERVHRERPPAETWGAESDPALGAALAELDAADRELLWLSAWEEFAPREIAVVLGISANAASIRLHRARQRLAAALAGKETAVTGHATGGHAKEAR